MFGLIYMFARISLNTTATMLPLYLTVVHKCQPPEGKDTALALAGVPLSQYLASAFFSVYAQNTFTKLF